MGRYFKKNNEKVLNVLTNSELFKKVLEFNKSYLYWSELKYKIKDNDDRKFIWSAMKLIRNGKQEKCSFKAIKLKYNLLSEFSKKLYFFDKQLAGNIGSQTATMGLEERYIISSLMEEAIASSIIEGASITRRAAKEMLKTKRKPRNRSEKMIYNNYLTMKMVSDSKKEVLTPKFLLDIQRTVTKDTLEDKNDEGVFRDSNDIVVSDGIEGDKIVHIPPRL